MTISSEDIGIIDHTKHDGTSYLNGHCIVLPFIHKSFAKYKFQSPQEIKNAIAYQISKELILSTFVQKIQKNKINEEVLEAINSLICSDEAS